MIHKIQIYLILKLFKNFHEVPIARGKILKLINIFGDIEIIREYKGLKLCVNSRDKYWLKYIISKKPYEPEIEQFLSSLDHPFFFIDIGANIGYWSIFVKTNFPTSEIIAIEPNPERYAFLLKNLAANSLEFTTINCGISGRSGISGFFVSKDTSLHAGASKFSKFQKKPMEIMVDFKTLDQILEFIPQSVSSIIVKLDVEGMEFEILESCEIFMERNIIVIFEEHGRDSQNLAAKYFLEMNQHNLYLLDQNKNLRIENLKELNEMKTEKDVGYNLVAIPKSIPK